MNKNCVVCRDWLGEIVLHGTRPGAWTLGLQGAWLRLVEFDPTSRGGDLRKTCGRPPDVQSYPESGNGLRAGQYLGTWPGAR